MSEVVAAIFRDGNVIEHVALDVTIPPCRESEFVWVEVLDPTDSDLAKLQERFGLHSLAVEDSMCREQMPKVDLYDDQIFVVLKVARLENDAIAYGEINSFVSARHIITVCHTAGSGHAHARGRFQGGSKPGHARPDFVLHGVLNFVVDGYFPVVQMVEEEVLSMEHHLQDAFLDRDEITRLFRLRREAIHLQHVLTRMSDVCRKLTNLDIPFIGDATKPYFRDVHDNLTRLDVLVSGLVDVIGTVFQTSGLLEQQRQGIITRQLAAWAAILGVPATIAGVYGMSSPNVSAQYAPIADAIATSVILAICVGLYMRFKRLTWL